MQECSSLRPSAFFAASALILFPYSDARHDSLSLDSRDSVNENFCGLGSIQR